MTGVLDTAPARYADDGFVSGPIVLRGARLEEVRHAVDRILAGRSRHQDELLVFRRDRSTADAQVHVVGAWRAEAALRDVAFDPVVLGLACELMGTTSVRLFRDQLFTKQPHSPSVVPWHQDYSDWTHTTPPRHVTCWIALDDASETNGCLHYMPGSHRGPLLPKITRTDDMESAFARLPAHLWTEVAPQPVPVPAGGCVLHHCMTVHASSTNTTSAPRRAVALTYMDPDTRSTDGTRPPLPGATAVPAGDRLEGPLFPRLTPDA